MTAIMKAATLEFRRNEQSRRENPPVSFGPEFLSSRIGIRLREQRCPACDAIIYSRRHGRCGVCERALPERLLFTSDEAEKVNALLKTERHRHREWLMRVGAGGLD